MTSSSEDPLTVETSPLLAQDNGSKKVTPLTSREITSEGMEYAVEQTGITVLEHAIAEDATENEDEEGSEELAWMREARSRHASQSWYKRPGLSILCLALILAALADTLIISPNIVLIIRKICEGTAVEGDTEVDMANCDMAQVQELLSGLQSVIMILSGIIGTLTSGKLGELSDRFGRIRIFQYMAIVRILAITAVGYAVLPSTPYNKYLIITANCVTSFASVITLIANGGSYISDIIEPEGRTLAISILMSTIYGSMGVGPLVGSLVIKLSGGNTYTPFLLAYVAAFAFLALCSLLMIEPRHANALKKSQSRFLKRKQSMASLRSSESAASVGFGKYQLIKFLDFFSPLKKLWMEPTVAGSLVPRYTVVLLIVMDVLFLSSTAASMPALVLYSTYVYKWDSVMLGYFISFSGVGRALVLLVISPVLLHYLKKIYQPLKGSIDEIDITSLRGSLFFVALSIVLAMLINNKEGNGLLVFAFFQALSAIFSPTLQASVVKYCSRSATGEVFGAIALIRTFVMLVCPPILLGIYGNTVSSKPKTFMIVPLALSITAIIISLFLRIVRDPELLRRPSQVSLPQQHDRRASTSQSLRLPASK